MMRCKYGDPTCPCQDGDMCHYEGPNPMQPRYCADCGALLDVFGTCPQADPRDAARMSKPVNCGRKQPLGGTYTRTDAQKAGTR